MRVRQRAYLRVTSDELDPGIISARLGLDPDETKLRHSRTLQLPPVHIWIRRSGLAETRPLDEHLAVLLDLIHEHRAAIRAIAALPAVAVTLMIVRNLAEGDEDFDEASYGLPPDANFERVTGQHPLLGWHLEPSQVALLAEVGAALDLDEYG